MTFLKYKTRLVISRSFLDAEYDPVC